MTPAGPHAVDAPGPDVVVITVTYDAADLVADCLRGLEGQELGDVRMEVVVVDNASSDGTADLVARDFPGVRLARSVRNLGFAAGNNLALRDVRAPYVILLNNDAVPDPGFVAALVAAARQADDDVAAVAARVLLSQRFRRVPAETAGAVHGPDGAWLPDDDGEDRLVNSTGNLVRADGFGLDRGWLADATRHHPAPDVFGFSGAAVLLRTAALREVGLFDERLFMYYEDTDLSWRLRRAGYRITYCEDAVANHLHSATTGEGSAFFRFHDARNRLVVVTKNASAGLAVRCVARFALTTASITLRGREPWRGRRGVIAVRLRALGSYVALLPHALRERRRIARSAQVTARAVESLLSPPGTGTDSGLRSGASGAVDTGTAAPRETKR